MTIMSCIYFSSFRTADTPGLQKNLQSLGHLVLGEYFFHKRVAHHVVMLVGFAVNCCMQVRVVPDVKVSVSNVLDHGVVMQDFRPLTAYCQVYAQLRGKVIFFVFWPASFPVSMCCIACPWCFIRRSHLTRCCIPRLRFFSSFSSSWYSSSFSTGGSSNYSCSSSSLVA